MKPLDFTMELKSDYLPKQIEYALFARADDHFQKLRDGHSDLTGAAINVHTPIRGQKPSLYEVTVVVYGRFDPLAATKKEESPMIALIGALDSVERQVRKRRRKLSKTWEQPGNHPVEREVMEVIASEKISDPIL